MKGKMKKLLNRICASVLAVVMVAGMLPANLTVAKAAPSDLVTSPTIEDYANVVIDYAMQHVDGTLEGIEKGNFDLLTSDFSWSTEDKTRNWAYYNGVMMDALLMVGGEKKLDLVNKFYDAQITDSGTVKEKSDNEYLSGEVDSVPPALALFDLLNTSNATKYKKAIQYVYTELMSLNTLENVGGNFHHKTSWTNYKFALDGLYMALPFLMECANAIDEGTIELYNNYGEDDQTKVTSQELYDTVYTRMNWVANNMKITSGEYEGIYLHGIKDDGKTLNSMAWLRGIGWYAVAQVDIIEMMPEGTYKETMKTQLASFFDAMIEHQRPSGMWFNIVNAEGKDTTGSNDNRLETSGTAMMAYALIKASQNGYVTGDKYLAAGENAFKGIVTNKMTGSKGSYVVKDILKQAGVADTVEGYSPKYPYVNDEAKGTGALIMAASLLTDYQGVSETVVDTSNVVSPNISTEKSTAEGKLVDTVEGGSDTVTTYKYVLTDSLTTGETYLIVTSDIKDTSAVALMNPMENNATKGKDASVTIGQDDEGNTIAQLGTGVTDASVEWIYTSNKYMQSAGSTGNWYLRNDDKPITASSATSGATITYDATNHFVLLAGKRGLVYATNAWTRSEGESNTDATALYLYKKTVDTITPGTDGTVITGEDITLNVPASLTLEAATTADLLANTTVVVGDGTTATESYVITWASDATDYATVSESTGVVTGVAQGTANITVTLSKVNGTSLESPISVTVPVTVSASSVISDTLTYTLSDTEITVAQNASDIFDDITLTIKHSNGDADDVITSDDLGFGDVDTSKIGTQYVEVTYGDNVVGTVQVNVQATIKEIESVALSADSVTSISVFENKIPDFSGVKATITYTDDSTEEVSGTQLTYSGYDVTTPDTYTVTVKYGTHTAGTITVEVVDVVVSTVVFTNDSVDTITVVQDGTVDYSGVKAAVTYNDGSTATVSGTDLTYSEVDTSVLGDTTVTVTYEGKEVGTITVTVEAAPTPVLSVDTDSVALEVGEKATVTAKVTLDGDDVTGDYTINWASSKESVATVSNGTITAVGAGTATITASISRNTRAAVSDTVYEITVTVTEPEVVKDPEYGDEQTATGKLPDTTTEGSETTTEYVLTDIFTAENTYVIATSNTAGSAYALKNPANSTKLKGIDANVTIATSGTKTVLTFDTVSDATYSEWYYDGSKVTNTVNGTTYYFRHDESIITSDSSNAYSGVVYNADEDYVLINNRYIYRVNASEWQGSKNDKTAVYLYQKITTSSGGSTTVEGAPITMTTPSSVELFAVDATADLKAKTTVTKADVATNDYVLTWSSDNTAVATVDANTGVVTAVSAGTANIIATLTTVEGTAVDGDPITDTIVVTVTLEDEPVDDAYVISVSPTTVTLTNEDAGADITASVAKNGDAFDGGTVTWTSSDEDVVTVSNGAITVVGAGAATVTATLTVDGVTLTEDNDITEATVAVTITDPVYKIAVDETTVELTEGKTQEITATVTKDGAAFAGGTITWDSSDDTVATVADGVITAVSEGTATITATLTVNGVTLTNTDTTVAEVAVTVKAAAAETDGWKNITVASGAGDTFERVDTLDPANTNGYVITKGSTGDVRSLGATGAGITVNVSTEDNVAYTITNVSGDNLWYIDTDGYLYCVVDGTTYYLVGTDSTDSKSVSVTTDKASATKWEAGTYSGGFSTIIAKEFTNTVYLAVKSTCGTRGSVNSESKLYIYTPIPAGSQDAQARLVGDAEYSIVAGTTEAEDVLAVIQSDYTVMYRTDSSDETGTAVAWSEVEGTWSPDLDPDTEGTYTYTVTYAGVELGTIPVTIIKNDVYKVAITTIADVEVTKTTTAVATVTKNDEAFEDGFVVEWSSSDSSIATINSATGEVKGLLAGEVTITAILKSVTGGVLNSNDTIKATTTVKVTSPYEATISVAQETVELTNSNNTGVLTATVTVTNTETSATFNEKTPTITWTSSNTEAVTVDENGNLKAVGNGTAIITATLDQVTFTDGESVTLKPGVSDTATVTVTGFKTKTYIYAREDAAVDELSVNENYLIIQYKTTYMFDGELGTQDKSALTADTATATINSSDRDYVVWKLEASDASAGEYYLKDYDGNYLVAGYDDADLSTTTNKGDATIFTLTTKSNDDGVFYAFSWYIDNGSKVNDFGLKLSTSGSMTVATTAGTGSNERCFRLYRETILRSLSYEITLDEEAIEVYGGLTDELNATVVIKDADTGEVVTDAEYVIDWASDNTAHATITENTNTNVTINGITAGSTNITATLTSVVGGGYTYTPENISDTAAVTVKAREISNIELLGNKNLEVLVGETADYSGLTARITYADGLSDPIIVTYDKLTFSTIDTSVEGVYTVNVSYGNRKLEDYSVENVVTVTVTPFAGLEDATDFAEYPNDGAVRLHKTTEGIDFFNTGVTKVELSAAGISVKTGVDVILVVDVSNSMAWVEGKKNTMPGEGEQSKLQQALESAQGFADSLLVNNSTGDTMKVTDNTVSIVTFAGYDASYVSSSKSYVDSVQTLLVAEKAIEDDTITSAISMTDNSNYESGYEITIVNSSAAEQVTSTGENRGGTNYDYAFNETYNAIAKINAANEAAGLTTDEINKRETWVVFMTDGAPSEYNQKSYKSGSGSNDGLKYPEIDSTASAEYKGCGDYKNASGWYNWINTPNMYAEKVYDAVKGNILAIGFDLANGGFSTYSWDADKLTAVLTQVASSDAEEQLEVYQANTGTDLAEAYADIANRLKLAGTFARVTDIIGGNFTLQTKAFGADVDNQTLSTMEVTVYDLITKAEVDEDTTGTLTAADIGKRSGASTLKEIIKFSADGKSAESSVDNGVTFNSIDITVDDALGVTAINATTFTYTKDENGVETLIWNINDIDDNEVVLSYYVYLKGSLEGTTLDGIYYTNEYAKVDYIDINGKHAQVYFDRPSIAWGKGTSTLMFYLVDEYGVPVNSLGEQIPFENRIYVEKLATNIALYLDQTTVVKGSDYVMGNYTLYDVNASFTADLTTGAETLTIADGKAVDTTNDTYGYVPSAYTSNTTHRLDTNDDAKNSVIEFAVIKGEELETNSWALANDVEVLDYGKTLRVDVINNNDTWLNAWLAEDADRSATVVGFVNYNANYTEEDYFYKQTNEGTETLRGNDGVFSIEGGDVKYSPFKFLPEVEKVFVVIRISAGVGEEAFYLYQRLDIVPATRVYFETDFNYDFNNGTTSYADLFFNKTGAWERTYDEIPGEPAQDKKDPSSVAFDTYGYDSTYENDSMYSNAYAYNIVGAGVDNTKVEFSFKGTGFDLYSRVGSKQGTIRVQIYKDAAYTELEKTVYVSNKSDAFELYQIPVVSIDDLAYGVWYVRIGVYAPVTNENYPDLCNGGEFCFDAISIHNPIDVSAKEASTGDALIAYTAYMADGEANATVKEVGDILVDAGDLDVTDTLEGAAYVTVEKNGKGVATATLEDYTKYGPNNEVYLSSETGIAFKIAAGANVASIDIGAKSADGNEVTLTASIMNTSDVTIAWTNNWTTSSCTAQNYDLMKGSETIKLADIMGTQNEAYVLVYNAGEGILSLTDIKVAYSGLGSKVVFSVSSDIEDALNGIKEPVYEIADISLDADSYKFRKEITMNVTTSGDVDSLKILSQAGSEQKITTTYVTNDAGQRVWTVKMQALLIGTQNYTIEGCGEDGESKVTATTSIKVTLF